MEPTHEADPTSELPMPVPGASSIPKEALPSAVDVPQEVPSAVPIQPMSLPQDDTADTSQSTTSSVPVSGLPSPSVPAANDSTLIADDADLIEKEWIVRAKAVVEQTKTDPHAQNRELNKVKAEYIKKRYNKDVKVSRE